MIFGEWRQWLNNLSRNTRGRAAGRKSARSVRPGLEVFEARVVPAVVYVDNIGDYSITTDQGTLGTLDSGDTVTWNPGAGSAHGGPVQNLTFGTHAFTSIQAAINAATAGDTVRVGSGTFAEKITVSKQLTLLGNQFDVDARTSRGAESVVTGVGNSGWTPFYVTANNVTLDGFTVEGATSSNVFGYGILLGQGTSGAQVLNNIIQNNIIGLGLANNAAGEAALIQHNLFQNNNATGPAGGNAIYTDQYVAGPTLANVTIDANTFANNRSVAVNLGSISQSNIDITNNTMTGNGQAVRLVNTTEASIFRNTITGSTGGSQVVIGGGVNDLSISENFIQDGRYRGIQLAKFAGLGNNQNVTISNNNISGNGLAGLEIYPGGYSGTLESTGNWWGTRFAAGVAAEIRGNVDFMPFLVSGEDTDLLTTGFQGGASVTPGEGNVRVKVVGGRLMITGDNLDNWITVEKGSTPFSYRVTGLAGTQINGQSGSFDFTNVTKGIDANLKRGDDQLVFDGSASPFNVSGTIKVRTGRGDDLVQLQGVTTAKADLGSSWGSDLIQLIDSTFNTLAVDWIGNGASTSLELDGVTVTGQTKVRGGNGDDSIRAFDSNLAGVLIQTGRGSDTVRLEGVDATGRVVLGGSLGKEDELDIEKGNTFGVAPVTRGFENILS